MRKLLLSAIMLVAATTYAQDKTRMFVSANTNVSQATYQSVFKQDMGERVVFTNKITYGTQGAFISHFKRFDITTSLDIKFGKAVVFSMGHNRERNIQAKKTFNTVFYKMQIKLF